VTDSGFPTGTPDEVKMHLRRLAFRRGAVLPKALVNETARHAGAVRELLDGTVGE
jgi:hypothetical protein